MQLILRPDIEDRNFHETTKAYMGAESHWGKTLTPHSDGFVFAPGPHHHLGMQISGGDFVTEPEWQYMVHRPMDEERGLDSHSDLFSPGYFSVYLKGGEKTTLTACVRSGEIGKWEDEFSIFDLRFANEAENQKEFLNADLRFANEIKNQETEFFENQKSKIKNQKSKIPSFLRSALNHFVVRRNELSTVIAGYPWFLDWGRDTLIVVRGMIASGNITVSRAILKQFARFEKNGTLPNMIRGNDAGNRDTSDALLWFFVACADLTEAEKNESFLSVICNERTIREILVSAAHSLTAGTPNGIKSDTASGLLFSPSHFTWMDTNHPAGTPREGYPIEIQALWHFSLCFLARIDKDPVGRRNWQILANKVESSIFKYFYIKEQGYLSDCLHAPRGKSAGSAKPDDALRPNQLFAITLGAIKDKQVCRDILSACEELLVPGAIRSLSDRPVSHPIEIVHYGNVINDPLHPYQGIYTGDEDTRRKPAYHNGTAWTWVFPYFCEAWAEVYGKSGKDAALAWLASTSRIINEGCAGQVPEILDGDFPHTQRGCNAQAWGVSEVVRVWEKITRDF